MADMVLKVTPSQLESKAKSLKDRIRAFEGDWKQLSEIIHKSKGYWAGDAGNVHQKYFKECDNDVKHILNRLKEQPDDLLRMAGVYKESENTAKGLAEAVTGDIRM